MNRPNAAKTSAPTQATSAATTTHTWPSSRAPLSAPTAKTIADRERARAPSR